jgi:hypothetical protein
VRLALELPTVSRVGFRVLDVQGREVWKQPARDYDPGRWTLDWGGRFRDGGPVPAGIYLAQVTVDGRSMVRRIAVMH